MQTIIFAGMKQPRTPYTLLIIMAVVAIIASCSDTVDHGGKTPIVSAGNEYLYKEDVEQLLALNYTIEDSAAFVDKYIKQWLEDALLYDRAKRNISSNKEISRLIENYKKSLLLNIYQERLVDQQLDKEITLEEVSSFYEANKTMFKVEEPMLKGLLLKVSQKAPKLDAVRKWCKSAEPDELEKYTLTNAQIYEYFRETWTPLSAIASKLSFTEKELKEKISQQGMTEFKDTASIYMININDYLPVGSIKPLDLAEAEIKELLVNSRKAEFLQKMKQNLYNEAIQNGEIKFWNKDTISTANKQTSQNECK